MTQENVTQSTPEMTVAETRKLATFRTIDGIEPIEGADAIELAVVGGWKVVIKKGEFQIGDPCVYFEIDSFLPAGNPAWQFLVDKQSREFNGVVGHRLRTIKLRGQISQGLVLPLGALPPAAFVMAISQETANELRSKLSEDELRAADALFEQIDANVEMSDLNLNELLNIVKWDPPLPASLAGQAAGLFPSFIVKTDQERCQNLVSEIFGYEDREVPFDATTIPSEVLHELEQKGSVRAVEADGVYPVFVKILPAKARRDAMYEISMKMDGSSFTGFHYMGADGVCSRNLELKLDDANKDNSFVRAFFDSGLNWALPKYGNIAIQGELMGPGIQNNREELKDFEVYVFDIQFIDERRKATPFERIQIMRDLYARGVNPYKFKHSPLMKADGTFTTDVRELSDIDDLGFTLDELGLTNVAQLLAFAEGPSIKHKVREGLVFKRVDGGFSFKAISNAYLAKEKD